MSVKSAKSAQVTKKQYAATGRRKTGKARVFLKKGSGQISVNRKSIEEYFGRPTARMMVRQPLEVVDRLDTFDIFVTVKGGGIMGQAGAIRHGISRALIKYDEEFAPQTGVTTEGTEEEDTSGSGSGGKGAASVSKVTSFRRLLRKAQLVTRDPRKVERKKVGLRKARKKEQYSKR